MASYATLPAYHTLLDKADNQDSERWDHCDPCFWGKLPEPTAELLARTRGTAV